MYLFVCCIPGSPRSDAGTSEATFGEGPPCIPWVSKRFLYVDDEGEVEKVSARSPRLRQARYARSRITAGSGTATEPPVLCSRETGVLLDEVVNRDAHSFHGQGIHPQVAQTHFDLFEMRYVIFALAKPARAFELNSEYRCCARRQQKLAILLDARAVYVKRDAEAAELKRTSAGQVRGKLAC